MGRTINVTNVKYSKNRYGLLNSLKAMPLHTDHPDADIIGWYCVEQSEDGGSSLLSDYEEIKTYISQEYMPALKEINVTVPDSSRLSTKKMHPLFSERGVYYASWLVDKVLDQKHMDALKVFQAAINRASIHRIRLNKGEALIIDNRRMLHGRERIVQLSKKRHLIRHWLSLEM